MGKLVNSIIQEFRGCKALKSEGYKVVLVNSNPATIMTDPEMADRTYIEPLVPEILEKIIEQESNPMLYFLLWEDKLP